jgi:hypothetical protein
MKEKKNRTLREAGLYVLAGILLNSNCLVKAAAEYGVQETDIAKCVEFFNNSIEKNAKEQAKDPLNRLRFQEKYFGVTSTYEDREEFARKSRDAVLEVYANACRDTFDYFISSTQLRKNIVSAFLRLSDVNDYIPTRRKKSDLEASLQGSLAGNLTVKLENFPDYLGINSLRLKVKRDGAVGEIVKVLDLESKKPLLVRASIVKDYEGQNFSAGVELKKGADSVGVHVGRRDEKKFHDQHEETYVEIGGRFFIP